LNLRWEVADGRQKKTNWNHVIMKCLPAPPHPSLLVGPPAHFWDSWRRSGCSFPSLIQVRRVLLFSLPMALSVWTARYFRYGNGNGGSPRFKKNGIS
jgi:hypothetical protein